MFMLGWTDQALITPYRCFKFTPQGLRQTMLPTMQELCMTSYGCKHGDEWLRSNNNKVNNLQTFKPPNLQTSNFCNFEVWKFEQCMFRHMLKKPSNLQTFRPQTFESLRFESLCFSFVFCQLSFAWKTFKPPNLQSSNFRMFEVWRFVFLSFLFCQFSFVVC